MSTHLTRARARMERGIESEQFKTLEQLLNNKPRMMPHELARTAKVPLSLVNRFFQSRTLRNQRGLSEFEKRAVAEALKPENQCPYEGPQTKIAYWLKSDKIIRQLGYRQNESGAKSIYRILEKRADSILDRIAENVFEKAYAPETIGLWCAEFPQIYYAHVAATAGTLPETAHYVLNKKFQMPQPNIINEIAGAYSNKGMTVQIAAETVRGIRGGQFRNNAELCDITRLAIYVNSKGVAEPLRVAEGLVNYFAQGK